MSLEILLEDNYYVKFTGYINDQQKKAEEEREKNSIASPEETDITSKNRIIINHILLSTVRNFMDLKLIQCIHKLNRLESENLNFSKDFIKSLNPKDQIAELTSMSKEQKCSDIQRRVLNLLNDKDESSLRYISILSKELEKCYSKI